MNDNVIDELENTVMSVIRRYSMLDDGDTVLAAVSGGADSMCLLRFFNKYSSKLRFNLIAVHVNHMIRGSEADRDEKFVEKYCRNNGIRFICGRFDIPKISSETGESEELCGRRLRYEFFSETAEKLESREGAKNVKIATAHNLNDSMETFVFNLARGASLRGLRGIPCVQGRIIRPLSECTRAQIEDYMNRSSIEYVTDSTNLCDEYTRNRIRHHIIPALYELNPSFDRVFKNCISGISDVCDYIEKSALTAFKESKTDRGFDVKLISALETAVKTRTIVMIAGYYGSGEIENRHVMKICGFLAESGACDVPGRIEIRSDGRFLFGKKKTCAATDTDITVNFDESVNEYVIGKKIVAVSRIDKSGDSLYNIIKRNEKRMYFLDAKKVSGAHFRFRRSGDRFRFPTGEHSKSLKNLFREKNISPDEREKLIFLADDSGNVLWIESIGVSYFARVTPSSEDVLAITVKSVS